MTTAAWRTLVVDSHVSLAYSRGRILVRDDQQAVRRIPLFDVRLVLIHSLQARLTTHLLRELHRRGIRVVFCDEKAMPYGEVIGYHDHHATAQRLNEQIRWKKEIRRQVWQWIVASKIAMQWALLEILQAATNREKWEGHINGIAAWDKTNREAQAARLYFNTLFGDSFHRRKESPINAALNYGYAVLCSAVTRALVAHGYHSSLGIAHRGATNPFNLTYDLMEPFRPFVDRIVFGNADRKLDREYKKQLIAVSGGGVRYREKKMTLATALDAYVVDVTKSLTTGVLAIGEIGFDDA